MATADIVKAKLQSVIAKANSATGGADDNVDAAVDALIAGFGQGGGITPTGTKTITTNGEHDVSSFAKANVNVPVPAQMTVVRTVTVAADVVGTKNYQMLTGDEFIKAHYADEGFSAVLIPLTPVEAGTNVVHFNYTGNRNIGSSNIARYGLGYRSTNANTVAVQHLVTPINGKGYSQNLRVDSSGNFYQYLHTDYVLKAGTYLIVLTCTT